MPPSNRKRRRRRACIEELLRRPAVDCRGLPRTGSRARGCEAENASPGRCGRGRPRDLDGRRRKRFPVSFSRRRGATMARPPARAAPPPVLGHRASARAARAGRPRTPRICLRRRLGLAVQMAEPVYVVAFRLPRKTGWPSTSRWAQPPWCTGDGSRSRRRPVVGIPSIGRAHPGVRVEGRGRIRHSCCEHARDVRSGSSSISARNVADCSGPIRRRKFDTTRSTLEPSRGYRGRTGISSAGESVQRSTFGRRFAPLDIHLGKGAKRTRRFGPLDSRENL
jgi:hypothetical protein